MRDRDQSLSEITHDGGSEGLCEFCAVVTVPKFKPASELSNFCKYPQTGELSFG